MTSDPYAQIRGRALWMQELAERGGKGTVDNIDARSLGRIAADLAFLLGEVQRLEARLAEREMAAAEARERITRLEVGIEEASAAWLERAEKAERALADAQATIDELRLEIQGLAFIHNGGFDDK